VSIDEVKYRLLRYVCLSDEEAKAFLDVLEPFDVSKKDVLVEVNAHCRYFYWVQEGYLMNFQTDDKGFDHVLQFAIANWWTADLGSYLHGTLATYRIVALTDCKLLGISKDNLDNLLDTYPAFERYFRIIFQNALVNHQKRIIQNVAFQADVRYDQFNKQFPGIELIVPLKHVASYLGITPQFLSKLRKRSLFNSNPS
jgi:CRP-like cAMP-binding protein